MYVMTPLLAALAAGTDPGALAAQLRACLTRQIAWLERALAALQELDGAMDDAEFEAHAEERLREAGEAAGFDAELQALAGAWRDAAGVSQCERDEVSALVRRADELAAQLNAGYQHAAGLAAQRAGAVKEALNELKRQSGVRRQYRPGTPPDALVMDRKA